MFSATTVQKDDVICLTHEQYWPEPLSAYIWIATSFFFSPQCPASIATTTGQKQNRKPPGWTKAIGSHPPPSGGFFFFSPDPIHSNRLLAILQCHACNLFDQGFECHLSFINNNIFILVFVFLFLVVCHGRGHAILGGLIIQVCCHSISGIRNTRL